MLTIPKDPDSLYFVVNKFWNGADCPDVSYHAEVWISQSTKGLTIRVMAPELPNARIPSAPHDTRVDGLWEYDVVEVFLVGEDGKYLEVELGAGGHWLVLGFEGVRNKVNDFTSFAPDHRHSSAVLGTWQSIITIPWDMIPSPLRALNAFVIAGGQFLALNAVPGAEPDFHQPATYPEAEVAV